MTLSPSRYWQSGVSKTTWSLTAGLRRSCMSVLMLSMPAWPLYIGAKTWISWAGIWLRRAAEVICSIILGICSLPASKYERSAFRSVKSWGSLPWRMSPARETMVESSLCRKICSSLVWGMLGICKRSAKTWPGLTEGNWSASPTIKSLVSVAILLSNWLASQVSTMENSSTMIKSASR